MHHMHHHGGGVSVGFGSRSIVGIVVMFLTGALLIGMAATFFMIGQASDMLYTPFMITAAALAPGGLLLWAVGIGMSRRRSNAIRLRSSGIPGQAQIVGLTQTGTYVNYQPVVQMQLQVTTATHAPYIVTRRELVPQIMTGLLTSGRPLPVMVDPANPGNLVILWESAMNFSPQGMAGAQPAGFGVQPGFPQAGFGAPPAGFGPPPMG